jgi:Tfp pilus assembly protein FimT
MPGLSISEMLIVLCLLSTTTIVSLTGFSSIYEHHEIQTFTAQLSSAIKLAQGLSLTRNEPLTICAQQQNTCQEDWQGDLVLLSNNNEIAHSFGNTPKNLTIHYDAFYTNNQILVQNHGTSINNGTFNISGKSHTPYKITISQQGVVNETSGL